MVVHGDKIHFIDMEYSGPNYAAFDIADHFSEFPGCEGVLDHDTWFPGREYQLDWIRTYLGEYNRGRGVTDEQVS